MEFVGWLFTTPGGLLTYGLTTASACFLGACFIETKSGDRD